MAPPEPPASSAGGVPGPVSFTGLIRNSWALLRANFTALFIVFLPLGAAFFIAVAPLLVLRGNDVTVGANTSLATSLTLALLTVLPVLVGGIAVGVTAVLVSERLVGRPSTVSEGFRLVRPWLGALLAAGLASSLLSIVLQLVVPPFAFFIHPLLYGPAIVAQVIVLEGADLKGALTRAGGLLRGDKPRIFMYLFGISLGASLLDLLLPGLAGAALGYTNNDVITVAGTTVAQIVVTAAITPFIRGSRCSSPISTSGRGRKIWASRS